ncbi:MAG: hypothetical protein WBF06_06340 [Candidatus Acidiferrales bacterium]
MRTNRRLCGWLLCAALLAPVVAPRSADATPQPQESKKDYLTDDEADKIRDAFTYSAKIKLFVDFAGDRVQKIKYELAHLDPADRRQGERINDLLNAYSGCVDDGDELVGVAVDKQQDVHDAMKIFDARAKDFLPYLQGLEPNSPLLDDYKDNLEDAIEATKDAMSDLDDAEKTDSTAPIRRKP